jgi:hypothetical protein
MAESLTFPSGEERGNFLVQMISTCLPSRRGRGLWVGTLWVPPTTPSLVFSTHARPLSLIGQLGAGWAKPIDTAAQDAGMGQVLPESVWRICAAAVAGGSPLLPRLLYTGKEYTNKRVKVFLSSFLYRNMHSRRGPRFFPVVFYGSSSPSSVS